jgi:hypothetical protein
MELDDSIDLQLRGWLEDDNINSELMSISMGNGPLEAALIIVDLVFNHEAEKPPAS